MKDSTGGWLIEVKSPPVEGKANEEVIRVLSEALSISRTAIVLKSGNTQSLKTFRIDILNDEEANKRLAHYLSSSML